MTNATSRWSVSSAIRKLGAPRDGNVQHTRDLRNDAARILRSAIRRNRIEARRVRLALFADVSMY